MVWGERRKAAAAEAAAPISGNGFNGSGNGSGYSIDQIEQIVRDGAPAGANRSDVFHTIVGHYVGCGWDAEQILQHLQQFPDGIGSRYLSEGRLSGEIARSASKYKRRAAAVAAVGNGWEAKAPSQPQNEPELDEDLDDDQTTRSMMMISTRSSTTSRQSSIQICRRSMHTAIPIRGRSRAG